MVRYASNCWERKTGQFVSCLDCFQCCRYQDSDAWLAQPLDDLNTTRAQGMHWLPLGSQSIQSGMKWQPRIKLLQRKLCASCCILMRHKRKGKRQRQPEWTFKIMIMTPWEQCATKLRKMHWSECETTGHHWSSSWQGPSCISKTMCPIKFSIGPKKVVIFENMAGFGMFW